MTQKLVLITENGRQVTQSESDYADYRIEVDLRDDPWTVTYKIESKVQGSFVKRTEVATAKVPELLLLAFNPPDEHSPYMERR